MQIILDILNNPLFTLLLGSIIGGIISLLITKRYSRKGLGYVVNGLTVIDKMGLNGFDHLTFSYKGLPVDRVILSNLALWNNGMVTIRDTDITLKNRLRLEPEEGVTILDYKVIYANNDSNDFEVVPVYAEGGDEIKHLEVTFDYIDRNDGTVVQFYHTGEDVSSVSFKGSVIGIKSFTETHGRLPLRRVVNYYFGKVVAMLGTALILLVTYEVVSSFLLSREVSFERVVPILLATGFFGSLTLTLMVTYMHSRRHSIPKDIQDNLILYTRKRGITKRDSQVTGS